MSGKFLRCEATYQGLPVQAVQYARNAGFQADVGYVDIRIEDLKKKLFIEPRVVPWRSADGIEWDGMMSILAESQVTPGGTVTSPPPLVAPTDGGLRQFGDLVLKMFDAGGILLDSITYKDVHIAASGMEEILLDLAKIEQHQEGTIRVSITDIRRWYSTYGAVLEDINVRLRSGEWDLRTLLAAPPTLGGGAGSQVEPSKHPWKFIEVMEHLFHQLPGSPRINSWSDIYSYPFDPPTDLIGAGEPAVEHLQRLLDRNGLIPQFQPDGSWTINKRGNKKYGANEIPRGNGPAAPTKVTLDHKIYENKSFTVNDRPPAVAVVGKKIVYRTTHPYVAVLPDVDGRIYRLEYVVQVLWGMKFADFNKAVRVGDEKRYLAVIPPTEGGALLGDGISGASQSQLAQQAQQAGNVNLNLGISGGTGGSLTGGLLQKRRIEIAKKAYRLYAPAIMFRHPWSAMADVDVDAIPFLPLKDCAFRKSELPGRVAALAKDDGSSKEVPWVISPPVVYARRVTQGLFKGWEDVERYFKTQTDSQKFYIQLLADLVKYYNSIIVDYASILKKAEIGANDYYLQVAQDKYNIALPVPKFVKDDDTTKAKQAGLEIGILIHELAEKKMTTESYSARYKILWAKSEKVEIQKLIVEEEHRLAATKIEFERLKGVYKNKKGLQLITNVGPTMLEDGSYALNPETGLLTAGDPLYHMDKPFVLDGDVGTVDGDGAVLVTAGYESDENNAHDYTIMIFTAADQSDDPLVILCGANRSSPIKCLTTRMEGRFYCLDLGSPVNGAAVLSEAIGKAAALLKVPVATEGYVYEFSGLRNAVLDGGATAVQHVWDGDVASTYVAMNASPARLPIKPGVKGGIALRWGAWGDENDVKARERR